ncbi:MAG TPA: N-acetylmuramoyl-L-alanine amidase [Acidimicrobiia bacterium]|nr:N-acetylmuramoyl-L-alanine amidase [Acidimicrobiia bacterium]
MNLRVLFLLLAITGVACSSGSSGGDDAASSTSAPPAETTSTSVSPETSVTGSSPTGSAGSGTTGSSGPASTTTAKPVAPPQPPPGTRVAASGAFVVGASGAAVASEPGGRVLRRLRAGVVMGVDALEGEWAHVTTPCENSLWVKTSEGHIEQTADIVIDPGHGGGEPGAVGPAGLTEKELNLVIAQMTADALRAEGVRVVLARTGDYRQSLAARVAVAAALEPKGFVSLHHNAAPDEAWPKPGTETYYQTDKTVPAAKVAESKRLAGLIYEEVVKALSAYSASWVADRDAGAKYRLGDSGDDYYGILRRSAAKGMVASLIELAFISNPSEEALLQRDDVRRAEANAVARGIVRFLKTNDPGSGFTTPYPRTEPAGGGGGTEGCTDPT